MQENMQINVEMWENRCNMQAKHDSSELFFFFSEAGSPDLSLASEPPLTPVERSRHLP